MQTFDIYSSPIRKNIYSLEKDQLSIFEDGYYEGIDGNRTYVGIQVRTILKDIEEMFKGLDKNKGDDVRIAVMGEYNAGKSTFINVLLEKETAFTYFDEATALIMEISYSDKEYVQVISKDGRIAEEFSVKESLDWMQKKLDEEADFSAYEKIVVGLPNKFLRNLIMIDTPGLFSITSQNHDTTNKFVVEADYILWIVDSTNLGSKLVNDYIDKLRLTGKPIIGIINKVDDESQKEEISTYIEHEYGDVFEEIYYSSAMNAWDYICDEDENWAQKTGFDRIIECIEDLKFDKAHSINKTQYYQLQRDKEVHVQMRERVKARKEFYDNELNALLFVNNELKKSVKKEIRDWYDDFYKIEETEMLQADINSFQQICDNYKSTEYLTRLFEEKYNEGIIFIGKKWKIINDSLGLVASTVDIDFGYDKEFIYDDNGNNRGEDINSRKDVSEGAKRGAAIGLALAGYTAWLGPASASIAFIEVVPIVIPFAIAGALFAGLSKKSFINQSVEKEKEKKKYIEELMYEIKKIATSQCQEMLKNMYKYSDACYDEKIHEFTVAASRLNFDFNEPGYSEFMIELDDYLNRLHEAICKLEMENSVEPPVDEIPQEIV